MSLKRQLLLVSLLALLLPWAGCQFIRETESALRASQQQMLASTAQAVADSLTRYADAFPPAALTVYSPDDQLYGLALERAPVVDGYFDDWPLTPVSLRTIPGPDGPIRYATGLHAGFLYLYVAVRDDDIVYADASALVPSARAPFADRVRLVNTTPPYLEEQISFAAEAPGVIVPYAQNAFGFAAEPSIRAVWQDMAGGFRLEARIPRSRLGTHLGLVIDDVMDRNLPGTALASFSGDQPAPFVERMAALQRAAEALAQPGLRVIITDPGGWRLAEVDALADGDPVARSGVSRWLRYGYDAVVEDGTPSGLAEPDPAGREGLPYVATALSGQADAAWFRGGDDSNALVAVAAPVELSGRLFGAVILQKGTDAILSLRNQGLVRLMNVTMIAMFLVAGGLLGYATWLSRRIRRLSVAAASAADDTARAARLPSAGARDEIGDLSRSFSGVLAQLGAYNEYLRTLASKLSHELRTPLAIVTSSLENLEHEALDDAQRSYTKRARDGADRLRRILSAMSEASRVEELMNNVDTERFALDAAVRSAVGGYRDVYGERQFDLAVAQDADCAVHGAPELLIQLLDKLVDNAVSFSRPGDTIAIGVSSDDDAVRLDVSNPGPPLPAAMRGQLFDSMVSVRPGDDATHLGLGLYVARLIAAGHNGRIEARDIDGGVRFTVRLPRAAAGGNT